MRYKFVPLLLTLILVSTSTLAATCTDGTDCYCDTVNDPNLLMCEDFESADYYENTSNDFAAGAGSPYDRGVLARWIQNYGPPSYGGNQRSSDPTPRLGTPCGAALCSGIKEYCSVAQGNLVDSRGADCWGPGINSSAGLDIQRSGDFRDEISSLSLTGGSGLTPDVGAGRTHMAYRIPLSGNDVGNGEEGFPNRNEIGITMLHGYSSNLTSTGVMRQPWKHEEWYGTGGSGGYAEHWNLGMTGIGGSGNNAYFPYQPFMWASSFANCQAAIAGATVHVGSAGCLDGGTLGMSAHGSAFPTWAVTSNAYKNSGVTNYTQAADFPFGTWQCHRAHISGMGTSNTEIKIWHNEKLIIHVSGFNGQLGLRNQDYGRFWWNAYSNQAQLAGGGLTEVAYRYRDNVHIRNGAPVSCAAIGFNGSSGDTVAPAAPSGLQVQ